MKIFDGVELKPTLTPTMQGVISWALLLANTVIEADRNYDERLARETGTGRPLTLDHVMEQSGLRIPGLAEALEQLMGGTEEAKQAANLLINNPDPAVLVKKFAEHLGVKLVAEPAAAATTTTPPRPSPTPPPTAPPSAPHPAATVAELRAELPAFRADFTREGREASKVTVLRSAPSAIPPAPVQAAEPASVRPALVGMIEHQLGALRRRMRAHQAELDVRLGRAEAELAELRRELDALRAAERTRAVAPRPEASRESSPTADAAVVGDRPAVGPAESAAPADVTVTGDRPAVDTAESAAPADTPVACDRPVVDAAESAAPVVEPVVGDRPAVATSERAAELDADLALPAASEPEAILAARLISDFAEEVEDHHQQTVARIVAVEREVSVTRALVERERGAEGAAAHG